MGQYRSRPMRPNALNLCPANLQADVFPDSVVDDFRGRLHIAGEVVDPIDLEKSPDLLKDVEVLVSTWGMPVLDKAFLDSAPKLRAVFYAAGSVKGFVAEES